ncbi:GlsB/YeaQ/YmgE family stress response membrane protein [bacterium]|nr:GlsB/YeaQ/YmgE family stress response membrane protein [bacterium]
MLGAIITGGIAGWLAGLIMKGEGYGILINIILGIVGGAIGNWVLNALGFYKGDSFIPSLLTALLGAVILISIVRAIRKK